MRNGIAAFKSYIGINSVLYLGTTDSVNYYGITTGNAQSCFVGTNSWSNGQRINPGSPSWVSVSDERSKENLVPITDGLNKVSQLRPLIGNYKRNADSRLPFLIAQDVQKVMPEAVNADDPDELGLRYTEVIPLLVSALHDAKDRIETLEAEVQQLKEGN